MRRSRLVAVLMLLIWLVAALPAEAQGTISLSIDGLLLDHLPDVKVLVTVRDANGVPVTGLGKEHFELVEDGRVSFSPAEVTTQVNSEAAVSTMLVIDVSGSMRGAAIDEAKRAATSFIDQLTDQDRAGLIAFSDRVDVDPEKLEEGKELGFTTDKNAVRNLISTLDTKIGWDTPLYDAIYKAVTWTSREPVGKRAVLLMTDGRDERDNDKGTPIANAGSLYAPDDPINEATRQGVPVFTIGLGGRIDSRYLSRLALRTGGQYQETPNPEELTTLFQKVFDQLKQQYVLAYSTGLGEDSRFHSLMVRVKAPQGQAFDEVKFWLGPEATPTAVVLAASGGAVGLGAAQDPTPVPTPEPTAEGFLADIRNTIEDTIEDEPVLAAAIVGGALLLIVLVVVLLVVLSRGRRAREAYAPVPELEEAYIPPPDTGMGEAVTGPRPAIVSPPEDSRTVDWGAPPPGRWPDAGVPPAPGRWPEAAGPQPFGPPVGAKPPVGPEGDVAQGGTRIIQRGPKHLAMLVDKRNPERKFDLKATMNVGRARDNHLVVDHPTVSRHHGWIKEEAGEFLVFDVGSANGTFVNDEKVEAPRPLQNGDVVRFGEVEFVYTKVF